jgi:hypothetical protein
MSVSPAMYDLLLEFKIERLSTQKVSGLLKKHKMVSAILTKKKKRSGFEVSKVTQGTVLVTYSDYENIGDRERKFEDIIKILQAAGYTLAIGFGADRKYDDEALRTIRQNGAVIVMKKKTE